MTNEKIRRLAKESGVPLWKIAHELGFSEPTMTRRLHFELGDSEKARIMQIIEKLSGEKT